MKHVSKYLIATLILATNIATANGLDNESVQIERLRQQIQWDSIKIDRNTSLKEIAEQLRAKLPEIQQINSQAQEGTVDSGGGTLISTKQGTGLFDLYLHNKAAFADKTPGSLLPYSKSYLKLGIDKLTSPAISIFQKTMTQLKGWESSSPVIVSWVQRSLENLPLYYVNYDLGFKDENLFVPENVVVAKKDLQQSAYYIGGFGAFVSKKRFEALSEKNQIALLIHESLRHAQINFNAGFTNEDIQKITAILAGTPNISVSADQIRFMRGPVLAQYVDESSTMLWTKNAINELCKESSAFCRLKALNNHERIGSELQRTISQLRSGNFNVPQDAYDVLLEMQSISIGRRTNDYREALHSFGRSTNFGWLDMNLRNYNSGKSADKAQNEIADFVSRRISAGQFITK